MKRKPAGGRQIWFAFAIVLGLGATPDPAGAGCVKKADIAFAAVQEANLISLTFSPLAVRLVEGRFRPFSGDRFEFFVQRTAPTYFILQTDSNGCILESWSGGIKDLLRLLEAARP
ncbi:MAG: hypothetical protein ACT4P2_09460 [Pseudomonadota bacterium]